MPEFYEWENYRKLGKHLKTSWKICIRSFFLTNSCSLLLVKQVVRCAPVAAADKCGGTGRF